MTIERGIILPDSNPQKEIQKHSETANWEYREYSQFMYRVGGMFMERFFNGLEYPDGKKVPNPIFAFDDLRNTRVLGQYNLTSDEYGLMYKITINSQHFTDVDGKKKYIFGDWALLEVSLHECLHAWQQHGRGKHPYRGGRNSHNVELVTKAKELGLNMTPVIGSHFAVADADSPFGLLMKQLGIARPLDVPRESLGKKDDWFEIGREPRKGRSSLSKWQCPECGLNVRMGIKGDPRIVHDPCSEKKGEKVFFIKPGITQTIYDSSIDPNDELDRIQTKFDEQQDQALQDEMDRWEDLGMYMDREMG